MTFSGSRSTAIGQTVTRSHRKVEAPHSNHVAMDNCAPFKKLSEMFAVNVYGYEQMKETLPKPVYANLMKQMQGDGPLDKPTADAVAHSVKVWAMERGATHFTHWFQPQTNSTAEKHDSFLNLAYSSNGAAMLATPMDTFSGSQLMQAEPDASSFPHGGVRTTFEARGYTVWDTTSPMFLQEGPHDTKILYIPSVFISYNGEALDEKTVLLRSCDAVSKAAMKVLTLLGDKQTKRVHTTLGTEQEFFLVDRALYAMRPDLKLTGRTLVGQVPAKHQQKEDHYFAHIPSRVLAAIAESEFELWRLGVPIKTRHNEVAPAQYEMAPMFEEAAVAVDHNLLTMDILHKVAHRHGLKCLFHEKPFAGVNGSGKHCNWSLSTDSGLNLLEPGEQPEENLPFLLLLVATLYGVKEHAGLLNCAIASAANEHRLGANEAPPAIISAFLGDQLSEVLSAIEAKRAVQYKAVPEKKAIKLGGRTIDVKVAHLPTINRDSTDRNRTSPFAFTGNKFEFRAVGSSQTPSFPVAMLNSCVAWALEKAADQLAKEVKQAGKTVAGKEEVLNVVRHFYALSKAVCFEGDGYSEAWRQEAAKRGLLNAAEAPVAIECMVKEKHRQMLLDLGVMTASEAESRFHVLCERYIKDLLIEAKTLRSLAVQYLLPASFKYRRDLATLSVTVSSGDKSKFPEAKILTRLQDLSISLQSALDTLDQAIGKVDPILHGHDDGSCTKILEGASLAGQHLKPSLRQVRALLDAIEEDLADELYPFPKYTELLFY